MHPTPTTLTLLPSPFPLSNDVGLEVFRGIRQNMESLMSDEVSASDLKSMALGLSHSLSRYKLKFSPDKVDTMIVQAIGLLDELDKEINTYSMRVKEWYGWHFPEVSYTPAQRRFMKQVTHVLTPTRSSCPPARQGPPRQHSIC